MTNQEAFDRVWDWFVVRKGQKSTMVFDGGERGCAYRGADGARCAVGCLIPDELYNLSMEQTSITVLLMDPGYGSSPPLRAHFSGVSQSLLSEMQSAHDGFDTDHYGDQTDVAAERFTAHMEHALRNAARIYDLTVPS